MVLSLTHDETALIRSCMPILRVHGEKITKTFYDSLLHARPDLYNMFNSANQANGRQPRALLQVIIAYAASPGHTYELAPRLERVCHKHCSIGVTPEQYDLVGEYLLQALETVLGDAFTDELRGAWAKSYNNLAKMLVGRESELYRGYGQWTGWRFFRVEHKVPEADDFCSFYLRPCDHKPLPKYKPGQYVSIRVEVPSIEYLQSRQYSLSDCPEEDYYRISVQRDRGVQTGQGIEAFRLKPGLVSNLLIDKYEVGDLIALTHPAGGFQFDPETTLPSAPLVFMSAGSGATSLVSILNTVLERDEDRPLSWIHCTSKKAAFEEHIRNLQYTRSKFEMRFLRNHLADLDYRSGTARAEGLKRDMERIERSVLQLDNGTAEYYICGPEAFAMDMSKLLVAQGVDRTRIKAEWFTVGELELKV